MANSTTKAKSTSKGSNSAKLPVSRSAARGLRKKIEDTLLRKEQQLNEVFALQLSTKNKAKLNDFDKNEIEIKAQMQILRFILS